MCCGLMSGVGGEPVIRDAGRVPVAEDFLSVLAQAGQGGTDAVHLPACRLGQIADRSAVRAPEQSDDRGFLRCPAPCGGVRAPCEIVTLLYY